MVLMECLRVDGSFFFFNRQCPYDIASSEPCVRQHSPAKTTTGTTTTTTIIIVLRSLALTRRASNYSRVGLFEGFLEVKSRDEAAVMEAVYTLGPLSVGMDACESWLLPYT